MKRALKSIAIAKLKDVGGATLILVAVFIIVFLSILALVIDGSHLYVVRNELQNAADAGALAGARFLYNEDGTEVNAGANQIAYDAALSNKALAKAGGAIAVDVNFGSGQDLDVQRGHWSFATHTFTPNDSLVAVDLWGVSTEDLDANTDFINAIRVVARRQTTPAASIFAKIFGYEDFEMSSDAIGYIGFAGTLGPGEVDQPIGICMEAILSNGQYSCNIGRMIDSGQNNANSETGGWTSFDQDNPCAGGTNAQEVSSLICGQGNPDDIVLGRQMATTGGQIQSAFNNLIACWQSYLDQEGMQPWNVTLPVISCPGNNVGTCGEVRGAVNVNIIWITGAGNDPGYNNAPTQMGGWSHNSPDGSIRWASFVDAFHLENVDGGPAPYEKKSIYFLPDCTPHELKGRTGGENFGVLARIPVLVK
jgi:Flp pilus assembly protein TadG